MSADTATSVTPGSAGAASATGPSAPLPVREPASASGWPPPARLSWGLAWHALWTSRLVILIAGVLAVLEIGTAPGAAGFDPDRLTSPFGYFGNLLVAPFARWDSAWYLAIAHDGYGYGTGRTAFFPLYPLLLRALGVLVGSPLVAGILISLVAFAVGLALLHRLARLDLDERASRLVLTLLAFCPMAYYFSAVYTESLYLALSVGCILRARRGGWASAGLLGGLAALSRNSGIVLVVPFLLLFLYGPRADRPLPDSRFARRGFAGLRTLLPRHAVSPQILWVALIAAGLGAYLLYLGLAIGRPLAPLHVESIWYHQFAGPFGGVWQGAVAAWDGLRQLLHGPAPPVYFTKAGGDPLQVAGQNLMLFGFLVLGVVALVGTFRRLPFAYGAYTLLSLAMPLSEPVVPQPLQSLPRYEVVLFPLFMWGAGLLSRRRGLSSTGLAALAVLLGLFVAEFATWRFVA